MGLFLIGLFVFFAVMIANAPASLLNPAKKHVNFDTSFSSIEGTIWNAQINNLTVENVHLGNVSVKHNILPLLRGEVSYSTDINANALKGTLIATRRFSGDIALQSDKLEIGNTAMSRLALLGVRLDGTATISDSQIVLAGNGCTVSEGHVETNVLRAPAAQFGITPSNLSGILICRDGIPGVELSGSDEQFGRLTLDLMVQSSKRIRLKTVMTLTDANIINALMLSGFKQKGNAIEYEETLQM